MLPFYCIYTSLRCLCSAIFLSLYLIYISPPPVSIELKFSVCLRIGRLLFCRTPTKSLKSCSLISLKQGKFIRCLKLLSLNFLNRKTSNFVRVWRQEIKIAKLLYFHKDYTNTYSQCHFFINIIKTALSCAHFFTYHLTKQLPILQQTYLQKWKITTTH